VLANAKAKPTRVPLQPPLTGPTKAPVATRPTRLGPDRQLVADQLTRGERRERELRRRPQPPPQGKRRGREEGAGTGDAVQHGGAAQADTGGAQPSASPVACSVGAPSSASGVPPSASRRSTEATLSSRV
jgi:hypothetical protein